MWREVVAHKVRNPVGQDGQIARSVVFPGEEEAMCFKWIQSVRRIDHNVAAWGQHAKCLDDGAPIVVDMFDDFVDRKSTRLNSSHEWISYAVFCLKKKKKDYSEQD